MKLKFLFFPLSLVIALFFFVYFTKPIWDEYSQNNKNLEIGEIDLKKIEENSNKLSEILAVYKQVSVDEKILLSNAIPESLREERLLKELNDTIVVSGVEISEIALTQENKLKADKDLENTNDVKKIKTSISLRGDYFGLKKALYSIENLNRFVRIDNFSIRENKTFNNLDLNLEVTLFYKENTNKSGLSMRNYYLDNLLKNGLEIETIKNYMSYRENVVDFSFIGSENKGKDNLFDFSVGTASEIIDTEKEIAVEEEVTIDSGIDQSQSVE